MADMVMTAGIHATGDVEIDFADVEQIVEIVKTLLDGIGNGNRLGIGQIAEIAARAADDAGQKADVGGCQTGVAGNQPECVQIAFAYIGEDHVLLVADAQFTEAVTVGEIGYDVHLVRGDVARGDAVPFQ